jgi:hypothetical protein
VCNGLDDDCDGQTDEDFECALGSTKPCVTSCGTQGTIACNETCEWETTCTPPREICGNGIDDDCNGLTDQFGVIGDKIEIAKGFCDTGKPSIAWTGKDYGIVWNTQCRPKASAHFVRVSKEGIPLTSLVPLDVGQMPFTAGPSIVWNGNGFNVTLPNESRPGGLDHLLILGLDIKGKMICKEIIKPTNSNYIGPYSRMTWKDNAALAVLLSYPGENKQGFEFLVLSSEGKKVGPGLSFIVDGGTRMAAERSVAWSDESFGFVWQEAEDRVYFNKIAGFPGQLSISPKIRLPVEGRPFNLAWSAHGFGVVWSSAIADRNAPTQGNERPPFSEIYFSLLSANGEMVIGPLQITNAKGYASHPSIGWTGEEFGIAWVDGRDGGEKRFPNERDFEPYSEPTALPFREIYFVRLSPKGEPIGKELRVSHSRGHSYDAVLTYADDEYSIFWIDYGEKHRFSHNGDLKGSLYFQRIGCQ